MCIDYVVYGIVSFTLQLNVLEDQMLGYTNANLSQAKFLRRKYLHKKWFILFQKIAGVLTSSCCAVL